MDKIGNVSSAKRRPDRVHRFGTPFSNRHTKKHYANGEDTEKMCFKFIYTMQKNGETR